MDIETIWIELLIGAIIGAFIFCFIAKYVFEINRFKRSQDAQVKILSEIAIKQGVDPEIIRIIQSEIDKT